MPRPSLQCLFRKLLENFAIILPIRDEECTLTSKKPLLESRSLETFFCVENGVVRADRISMPSSSRLHSVKVTADQRVACRMVN